VTLYWALTAIGGYRIRFAGRASIFLAWDRRVAGERWGKFAVAAMSVMAVLVVLAPPANAEGEPTPVPSTPSPWKASNGYRMLVLPGSQRGYRDGEVLILVGRKGGAVGYFAPAKVTDTVIDADLGALGRIALRRRPLPAPR
jgi:hypothetical protein